MAEAVAAARSAHRPHAHPTYQTRAPGVEPPYTPFVTASRRKTPLTTPPNPGHGCHGSCRRRPLLPCWWRLEPWLSAESWRGSWPVLPPTAASPLHTSLPGMPSASVPNGPDRSSPSSFSASSDCAGGSPKPGAMPASLTTNRIGSSRWPATFGVHARSAVGPSGTCPGLPGGNRPCRRGPSVDGRGLERELAELGAHHRPGGEPS